MIIRAVTDGDVSCFQDIMRQSITELCAEAYGVKTVAAWTAKDNPVFHFALPQFAFVVDEEGEILAVGGWSLTDRVDLHPVGDRIIESPTHARINAVYMKPGAEGRGLGRRMLAHLEADIRATSDLRDIYLWATKNAVGFYETQGFTPGISEHPQVAEGFTAEVRYMWKSLG